MVTVNYNERSWAIDVISEINVFLATKSWHIKSAGGENTIISESSSLFPDVLIFKDRAKELILHGWELKMPDTPIHDSELLSNAIQKASTLRRDSFLLWNVKSAVLYVKNENGYSIFKSWDPIGINSRTEVRQNVNLWKGLLHIILEDLNNFFESGAIQDHTTYEILAIDKVIDIILESIPETSENLKRKARSDGRLEAKINQWWLSSAQEYGYNPASVLDKEFKLPTLSKVVLTDWVFKIIFANILKRHFNEARQIETIDYPTSVVDAKQIVREISQHCNFWNIFSDNLALEHISERAWTQIVQLNKFLSTINLDGIDIEILHDLLQSSIESAKRKVAGQFSTPKKLADLLTRLTIEDKDGYVLDPCCGTGTIINQAYVLKKEYDIPEEEIIAKIWASDKHSFPIQLSTLTLTKPDTIGKVLNVFRSDIIDLKTGQAITFKDPNNGNDVVKTLPSFKYIVSNLPFIRNNEIEELNPDIFSINDWIREQSQATESLSGKSDIFAYIPFYLHSHLEENGKIGVILSNAWMGTDYGEIFLKLFQKFFSIETVVISGKGKWFHNAQVVTTIIVARKRNPNSQEDVNREITFCTLHKKIEAIDDIKLLSENIFLRNSAENLKIQCYSLRQITQFETFGIPWSAYFSDARWTNTIADKLINAKVIFSFARGERRGQNALFYPKGNHGIESEYLFPLLKDLKKTKSLKSVPNKVAFCCSRSIEELTMLNHTGALNWIRSFENQVNGVGRPLPQTLARTGMLWYEMKPKREGDFVANINYDKSLFISSVPDETFIDQRMIIFTVEREYQDENKLLLLALLNSILSMFFIESFGFGRGLGALDLRETKFKRDFKILNPGLLTEEQKNSIIHSFEPLTRRDRLPLEQELLKEDRIQFERVLFEAYGIQGHYESIHDSLLHLFRIRFSVKDSS